MSSFFSTITSIDIIIVAARFFQLHQIASIITVVVVVTAVIVIVIVIAAALAIALPFAIALALATTTISSRVVLLLRCSSHYTNI